MSLILLVILFIVFLVLVFILNLFIFKVMITYFLKITTPVALFIPLIVLAMLPHPTEIVGEVENACRLIVSHTYRFTPDRDNYASHRVDSYALRDGWMLTKTTFATHYQDSYATIIHAGGSGPDKWYLSVHGIDLREMTHDLFNNLDTWEQFDKFLEKYFI